MKNRFVVYVGAIALIALMGTAAIAQNQSDHKKSDNDGADAGIKVSGQARARDTGLPLYPGAKPYHDDKDNSSAANLGLWGGSFGFKLVVLKLQSGDSPAKVSAFYQKALAKYGKVLDCTNPSAKRDDKQNSEKSDVLTCDEDQSKHDGQVFKSGTRHKQHIVAIEPNGQGSKFDLIYIEAKESDDDREAL